MSQSVRRTFQTELSRLQESLGPSQSPYLVFDGLHALAALHEEDFHVLSRTCQGIIYRAHNFETTLWEQCALRARTPWFRSIFRYQAGLVRHFEARVARSVNLIAPVSEEDAAKFRSLAPEAVVSVTPIGLDFPDQNTMAPIRDAAKLELLFIGRLDWIPNRNGLQWFLEVVWPRLITKRNVSLRIAGVGDGRWLEKFRELPGVEFLGRVDDIEPLYQSCTLAIAPLFQGSGTRVKIIESARNARAVITTSLGAEGLGLIPGYSYYRAEHESDWLNVLETLPLEDCRRVGANAFRAVRERFDGKMIAKRFIQPFQSAPRTVSRV